MDLLWDVRTAMEEKEARTIEKIINSNLNKKSYYIFVHANWINHDCEVMKTTYMLMSRRPPKMLGTKLYIVNNQSGKIKKLWELPMDVLVPGECLDMQSNNTGVLDSVKSIAPVIQVS